MGETSPHDDADEAAFKRLADGLAALRRETDRLRDTTSVATAPFIDQQAVTAALADINRRIDALAGRNVPVEARADTGPILAALAVVEEKLGTLTAGLDRFAERSALAEGLAKQDAKLDTLAARLDARLNRVQEMHSGGAMPAARSQRFYVLALAVLLLLLIGAAGAIVLLRPDLVNERLRMELVDPARDTVKRWLRISQAETPQTAASVAFVATPDTVASSSTAEAKPGDAQPDQAKLAETPVSAEVEVPPVILAADPEPSPNEALPVADATVAEPPPAPPTPPQIVLGARSDAWLLVRGEDGHTLLARVLHEGETWTVPDKPGLRLTTGNATATILKVNGTTIPILGGIGNVRRDIPLDARLLRAEKLPATASR
jgi:hypothetical protein